MLHEYVSVSHRSTPKAEVEEQWYDYHANGSPNIVCIPRKGYHRLSSDADGHPNCLKQPISVMTSIEPAAKGGSAEMV